MKPNVLLVDDDARNRFALREALHGLEADFVEVDSGEAALRAMLGRDFAVVLLDVAMPGLDGFETAALIRSRDRHRRTAIIFVSAHPDRRGERRGGEAEPYLLKPLSPDVVRTLVAQRLESYRLDLARE